MSSKQPVKGVASDGGSPTSHTRVAGTEPLQAQKVPPQKVPIQDISSKVTSRGSLSKAPSRRLSKISALPANSSQPKSVHDAFEASSLNSNQVRVSELQNYVVNKIELLKKTQANVKKLTQLAAFIPDFILKEETSRKVPYQRSTDAVVFMVDVSGFTALTEAYSLKGKGGTDQLTKTLMSYIGPLAETILLCEGDIVKYAGDAFLAFWSTSPANYAEDVQRAVDCALYIQEKYGSYLCKEVDITIRVKIGIGAGTTHLCGIGNDSYQHYVAFGPGVQAASNGEKHCVSGEVVLHESAWAHCTNSLYKSTVKSYSYRVVTQINGFINPDKRGRPMKKGNDRGGPGGTELIRPSIAESIETKPEEFMRRFIIPPVLRKVDDDIPLEYLNESRMVCICFIHVDTIPMNNEGTAFRESMTQIVNKCFVKIYSGVTRMQGALTKVIMFDKGLTYLVVFGLPGYINEHQCAHALKFSYAARRSILGIPGVEEVSIGVTTGACYSGVLGHPRRQEYTVMGRKVNKAARLMCYYPARVSCDQDTAYHSKLASSNFELQEYKELKGIANPGKIFAFINAETQEDNSVTTFSYPMVGRDAELRFFKDILLKTQAELKDHNKLSKLIKGSTLAKETGMAKGIWMLVFEGENGIGKSRMLAACMTEAEKMNNVQVFSVGMNLMMTGQTMFGLSSMIMDAIGIGGFRTSTEREEYIRKHVHEPDLAVELCVLNDILHTKFQLNPKYSNMETTATQTYGQHVLSSLLKSFYPEDLIMLAVDDAQYLDLPSWDYLLGLCKSLHVFCLLTIRRNSAGSLKIPDSVSHQIYHGKNSRVVRLNGLDPSHCKTLACQMMEVSAIPVDLEKVLMAKSQGVPAWCDQVLHELVRTGVLQIVSTAKKAPMVYADKGLLQKLVSTKVRGTQKAWASDDEYYATKATPSSVEVGAKAFMGLLSTPKTDNIDPSKRLLVVKSGTNIGHIQIHGTLHEILLDSYDELNSNEQIILKCASVLGRTFSRLMVTRILPFFELNAKKYESGFNHLLEARYLRCASGVHSKASGKDQTLIPECFCKEVSNDPLFQNMGDTITNANKAAASASTIKRPKYLSCKFMEFAKETLTEVVYGLMTQDQRKDFHLKAAKYLDSGVARCESCGGHNSAFAYGVVLKGNEIGTLADGEDALRAARRKSHDGVGGLSMANLKQRNGRKRASLQTQIAGMRRKFQNDGSKIAQIELEILTLLRKIDLQERRKKRCCVSRAKEDAERELNEELHLLRDADDHIMVNLKSAHDSTGDVSTGDAKPSGGAGEPAQPPDRNSQDNVDLRLCECSAIQAKVCIEMVKHYREAQKFGKCMANLLEAAESVITIGNGNQGLVHLEDAAALLKSIRNGTVPRPEKDDQDDIKFEDAEIEGHLEYLNGLAFFEMGVYGKSREFFLRSLTRLGLTLTPENDSRVVKESSLFKAKTMLWTSRLVSCCIRHGAKTQAEEEIWTKKLRILSYLHTIFKQDRKLDLALLVSIWEVVTAERYGDTMHDLIPAYCNMMATHTAMANHSDARRYEKQSLNIIRNEFATSNEQLDPAGLLSTAGLFHAIAYSRLCRGDVSQAADAAYLGLRIAQTIHDNSLMVRLLPSLTMTLLMGLRIPELVEALQKLWYIAEEEDDWNAMSVYYALCLDLLLRTAYPLETFAACENFLLTNDWGAEGSLFKDVEVLFTMEASVALWYARYSRWDQATTWLTAAESHRPKLSTFLSCSAELKLLECQLIFVNHYLDGKRYQHFAKARNSAKELMRQVCKSTKIAPVMKARQMHLMAYYYKIRSRNVEAEKNMKRAEKIATSMNNELELQWILHNRTVWSDMAIPTIKFFWLEHTENRVLDWHTSGKIPWANIMYSLPLPTWK